MTVALRKHTTEFATCYRDFRISYSQAHSYCINGHFYYVPHSHGDYFDLIYVAEGYLNETINGRRYVFGPGDLAWIRPGDWHEESGNEMTFFVICGTSRWMESVIGFMQAMEAYHALNKLSEPPRANVPESRRGEFRKKWERSWEVQFGSMGHSHAVDLVSELFVGFFLPQVEHAMQQKSFPPWFREAMNYIQNHVGEEITSEMLADICDKSPEHVSRCFKSFLGLTPSQYINLTRLNYASRLLTTTNEPIINISMTAGFGSLGHFYRLFKSQFKYSPRTYRLKNKRF